MILKRFFYITILIMLAMVTHANREKTAITSEMITSFHDRFAETDYQGVMELGEKLILAIPEDEIIRFKYCHVCFRYGRFDLVLTATENIPNQDSLSYIESIEELGFYQYTYDLLKLRILSLAATDAVNQALQLIDQYLVFNDPYFCFLKGMLLLKSTNNDLSENRIHSLFIFPESEESRLYVERIIPIISNPHQINQYLHSSTTHYEYCLLKACAGFSLFQQNEKERGIEMMREAVSNENPTITGSIPLLLMNWTINNDIHFQKILQEANQSYRWSEYARIEKELVDAFVFQGDYERCIFLCDRMRKITPQDIDCLIMKAIQLMIMEYWNEAEIELEKICQSNAWNSENVVCAKVYLSLIYRILGRNDKYHKYIVQLQKEVFPQEWQWILDAVCNHQEPCAVNEKSNSSPNKMCVWYTVKGLMSELDGDYVAAVAYYQSIVENELFLRFLEYPFADSRLCVVIPLAVLQAIE